MFSFHKPKIYRSNLGCCICKAKSSSSRFTDSKKYENEFERCFRIQEKRSGEICNACVLLVKRWKKLSPDNRQIKHWHHVVDARAGPGTKITGNRRITSTSSQHNHQHQSSQDSSSNQSRAHKSGGKSDVLPLSSSQTNNQTSASSASGPSRGRTNSLSKARAIDTNVSTFTFGEPPLTYRRSYMSTEPTTSYASYSSLASTSSPITKPQSALSSSAFESVIKRFRQRQQQQQLESQRRQLNRLERQRTRKPLVKSVQANDLTNNTTLPKPQTTTMSDQCEKTTDSSSSSTTLTTPNKRVKRTSENYGSFGNLDAVKVLTVLDSSIWRREKICCGFIFRGPYNEVAVCPRLLKPCHHRLVKAGLTSEDLDHNKRIDLGPTNDDKDLLERNEEPPPRANKSGSISSCDSSTSGTGSIEPTLDEIKRNNRNQNDPSPAVRPRTVPTKRRRQAKDDVESNSTSGASTLSSSGKADSPSGSDHSSTGMMILVDGCAMMEDEDDDEDEVGDQEESDELVMAEVDASESSNDASSSAESLVEMETSKKSSAVA